MTRTAPLLLLLALLASPACAQEVTPPGRQVVESEGFLAEVTYTSERVRVFDLDGAPIDLRGLWIDRCAVELITRRGTVEQTASRKVELVVPEGDALPYLEARHQLGALAQQDHLLVSVRLKNLAGRGDRTVRLQAEWQRVEHAFHGCSPGRDCRGDACRLCERQLCRRRVAPTR